MHSTIKLLFPNIDKKLYQEIVKSENKLKITDTTCDISDFIKNKMNASILEYIDHRISKVLIVEINLKRINNEFNSKDFNEQYNEFVTDFDVLTNLSLKYPSLVTEVKKSVCNIIDFYMEFLKRLQNDYKEIRMNFGIKGEIQDILLDLGDSHRGHRSVLEIKFTNKSVFYKPRNSYGDIAIENVSKWLQNSGITSFKVPHCLAHKNYSWVQGINYLRTDENEIKSIYYQFGTLAAISYIFNLSDLHMENVIASNGHLYLVDAETLLQDNFIVASEDETAKDIIYKNMRQSVLMTNLFPTSLFSDENAPDISGLTGHGGQLFKHRLSKIENPFTSKIRLRKIDYINSDEKNIPYTDDIHKKINPKNYTKNIISGFEDTFSVILKNKTGFLTDNDIWGNFSKGIYRIIFKNTSAYSAILNIIDSPKYAQSKTNVNLLLNLLKSGNNINTSIYNVFSSEVADIYKGDIPYFYKKSDGLVVYNSNDKQIYSSNIFKGIDAYKTKIWNFSNRDIERQIGLIKVAMAIPVKNWDLGIKENYTANKLKSISYNKDILNNEINAILEKIMKNGVKYKNTINWQNIKILENSNWIIGPSDFSLYDGLAGIGITFAIAYKLTSNNKYLEVLNKCLKEIDSLASQINEDFQNYSMFNGIGSLIYFYFYLYSLLYEEKYLRKGMFYLKSLQRNIDDVKNLDFIDGASGILVALCELENNFPDLDLKKSINNITNKIIKNWDNEEAWKSDIDPDHHLNGMSHGLSGIIYALYKARDFNKNPNLDLMIEKAIQIENNGIDDKNWIDLRSRANRIEKGFPDPVHWCHGAPGIGLSRIILGKVFNAKQDIELAKLGTLEKGIGGSDCLCHGSLGNLELFILDYLTNNNLQSLETARKIATDLCSKKDWLSGIPQRTTVFGMMTGLSGIAYELMRILCPNAVPSVLLLELNKN